MNKNFICSIIFAVFIYSDVALFSLGQYRYNKLMRKFNTLVSEKSAVNVENIKQAQQCYKELGSFLNNNLREAMYVDFSRKFGLDVDTPKQDLTQEMLGFSQSQVLSESDIKQQSELDISFEPGIKYLPKSFLDIDSLKLSIQYFNAQPSLFGASLALFQVQYDALVTAYLGDTKQQVQVPSIKESSEGSLYQVPEKVSSLGQQQFNYFLQKFKKLISLTSVATIDDAKEAKYCYEMLHNSLNYFVRKKMQSEFDTKFGFSVLTNKVYVDAAFENAQKVIVSSQDQSKSRIVRTYQKPTLAADYLQNSSEYLKFQTMLSGPVLDAFKAQYAALVDAYCDQSGKKDSPSSQPKDTPVQPVVPIQPKKPTDTVKPKDKKIISEQSVLFKKSVNKIVSDYYTRSTYYSGQLTDYQLKLKEQVDLMKTADSLPQLMSADKNGFSYNYYIQQVLIPSLESLQEEGSVLLAFLGSIYGIHNSSKYITKMEQGNKITVDRKIDNKQYKLECVLDDSFTWGILQEALRAQYKDSSIKTSITPKIFESFVTILTLHNQQVVDNVRLISQICDRLNKMIVAFQNATTLPETNAISYELRNVSNFIQEYWKLEVEKINSTGQLITECFTLMIPMIDQDVQKQLDQNSLVIKSFNIINQGSLQTIQNKNVKKQIKNIFVGFSVDVKDTIMYPVKLLSKPIDRKKKLVSPQIVSGDANSDKEKLIDGK